MNRQGKYPSPVRGVRILCFWIIAVFLAQPVMAALPAAGCGAGCRCCPASDRQDTRPTPGSIHGSAMNCCGAETARTCHLNAMDRPDDPPALIRSPGNPLSPGGNSASALAGAAVLPLLPGRHRLRTDTGSPPPRSRLYLTVCHLIC